MVPLIWLMEQKVTYRVLDLSPRKDQANKPSELIQVTGHEELTLNARRSITVLWHNAHRQGIAEGKDYTIEIEELIPGAHKGYESVEEAVVTLMKTLIVMQLSDGSTRRVQFLGGNDIDSPHRPAGVLTYSFDKRLVEILQKSEIWGKISLPVLMSISSKYGISLYENVSQWSGLTVKTTQKLTLAEFRELLGIEKANYQEFGHLNHAVIKPVVRELNALAPFNITILPVKTGRKVTHIHIGWWVKNLEENKAAWTEIHKSRIGRKARISDQVEYVIEPSPSASRLTKRS